MKVDADSQMCKQGLNEMAYWDGWIDSHRFTDNIAADSQMFKQGLNEMAYWLAGQMATYSKISCRRHLGLVYNFTIYIAKNPLSQSANLRQHDFLYYFRCFQKNFMHEN